MQVGLRLYASLREGRFGEARFELPVGASVGDLVAAARVPATEVAFAFVGGELAASDRPLSEGEVLVLFPAIGGG